MRKTLVIPSLAVSLLVVGGSPFVGSVSQAVSGDPARLARIKQALVDRLCYDVYWQAYDYPSNVAFPLQIVAEDSTFYARIERITSFRSEAEPVGLTFAGRDSSEHAAVVTKAVVVKGHEQPDIDQKFAGSEMVEDTLTIPSNCAPRYDPPTAEKQRMLNAVIHTMEREIAFEATHRLASQPEYPKRVSLRISDFNVDYPYTYVLVEPVRELFEVALHDPDGKDENSYQERGEYLYRTIDRKSELRRLTPKIQAHCIIKEIALGGDATKVTPQAE